MIGSFCREVARTVLLIGAAAALSGAPKVALANAATDTAIAAGGALAAGGGLFGFLKAVPPTIKTGAMAMSLKTKIAAAIAAIVASA